MQPLRLFVIADDPLARAGLAALLARHPECEVIGQFSGADILADAEEWVGETAVSLIWDLGWDFDGTFPDWQEVGLPIIVLVPDDIDTPPLLSSGINGILPRSSNADTIIAGAHAASHNLIVFDSAMIQYPFATPEATLTPVEDLTPREMEVIQLIAEGMTNKAIAQQLAISSHTVKFHVNAIMNKLGAQSRTAAVVRATRMGFISL